MLCMISAQLIASLFLQVPGPTLAPLIFPPPMSSKRQKVFELQHIPSRLLEGSQVDAAVNLAPLKQPAWNDRDDIARIAREAGGEGAGGPGNAGGVGGVAQEAADSNPHDSSPFMPPGTVILPHEDALALLRAHEKFMLMAAQQQEVFLQQQQNFAAQTAQSPGPDTAALMEDWRTLVQSLDPTNEFETQARERAHNFTQLQGLLEGIRDTIQSPAYRGEQRLAHLEAARNAQALLQQGKEQIEQGKEQIALLRTIASSIGQVHTFLCLSEGGR